MRTDGVKFNDSIIMFYMAQIEAYENVLSFIQWQENSDEAVYFIKNKIEYCRNKLNVKKDVQNV
jgi:hypothetical protein